ncbi:benzoate/H(+) symporter BenE family transporter [Nocardioides kribbensis]|uniref:benzoate/H(+) symporter BenE family transporter n=1 Tax=Nocardioides kribbensis TaxID=305517 RepID=UPI00187992F9|nr:benzoate/H(+) symporter BenE family transporter [Nocardioides kribbensis]
MPTTTDDAPEAPAHGSPVLAGVVVALVGFSSSFAVVLAGLVAVGASPTQAASGLLTLCVTQALGMLWLSLRHRIPLTLAWSTPGAALLATTGGAVGGWPAAVGAFVATGALVLLTAAWPRLGDLVARVPPALARAMLAGVLLPLCLAPVTALATDPWAVAPVVVVWLVLLRAARRWAAPAALGAALVVAVVDVTAGDGARLAAGDLLPRLDLTAPTWTLPALVGLALPLYVVTMASQNLPGVAVMSAEGYAVPWRESMAVTGVATVVGAPAGAHAVNLAAITAALAAGPEAGPDRERRWVAAVTAAVAYLALAVASAALASLVAASSSAVVPAAAGLALLGTFAASASDALGASEQREAAAVTFLVAASGVVVLGVGAAFWALLAGLGVRAALRAGPRAVTTPRR